MTEPTKTRNLLKHTSANESGNRITGMVNDDNFGVEFPYSATLVSRIKLLGTRKWNPEHKRWEIHLRHLREVMDILSLEPKHVPPTVWMLFRKRHGRTSAVVRMGPLEGKIMKGEGLPLNEIDAATSYFMPGYTFAPRFKSGKWDGRKHLFRPKTQTFPSGLWPVVRGVLERHEVGIKLIHETPDDGGAPLKAGKPKIKLRDYQAEALNAALEARRGIIQIATGGGKTLLAAHLIREIDRPALFFVHTRDLLHQTVRVMEQELGLEIGILGDGQAKLRPVTVATIQTAIRAFESRELAAKTALADDEQPLELDDASRDQIRSHVEKAETVIFDECHHVPADSFYKIAMKTTGACWRFGLSATPWREDEEDMLLEAALGPRISVVKCSDLIERKFLISPTIRMRRAPHPTPPLPKKVSWAECYQQAIVENQERNRLIATQAKEWADKGLSVLILVAQIAHGEQLQNLLPEALFAHGKLESQQRQEFLQSLEQKLHPVLIATTLADEGLDIPSLDALILAGGGKSATRAYQRIGRVLRRSNGKTHAHVLDFMDDAPYLTDHSHARLRLYQEEPLFEIELES